MIFLKTLTTHSRYGLKLCTFKSIQVISRYESSGQSIINDSFVHRLSLKTCQSLYDSKYGRNKWYLRGSPKSGLNVNVEYVDTKPNDRTGSATLVALHGCPGSYIDYTKLIENFGQHYRVIIPNFPDFSLTNETNHFWHSGEEKSVFVTDFLQKLNVQQIDCLICHSSSIFAASYLWSKDNQYFNQIDIKTLCLLSNPGPKWFTIKGRLVSMFFTHLSRLRLIRQYLRSIWSRKMTKRLGFSNQIEDYDRLALLLSTYYLSQTQTVTKRLKKLIELKIPTLFIFSSKDKLFNKEIFYNLFGILETDGNDFDIYEEHQNILIQKAREDNWIKVIDIRSGGHYVFVTHHKLVHQYIEQLLEKVK
ncbi:uncharacterized protein LOC128960298 [Oppia nitens]|uniref:uncharacterized protein LOC128960298 n=1 Tax=Oppia nitens TaxID=1686743 RepID=UPI0023DC5087|nr:uncharacterized protein LOC128960298 [Oppia nitens]